jgi:carbon storage regulator
MLVLKRRNKESFQIGKDIEITVLVIKNQLVHLGVTAPKDLRVKRSNLSKLSNHFKIPFRS